MGKLDALSFIKNPRACRRLLISPVLHLAYVRLIHPHNSPMGLGNVARSVEVETEAEHLNEWLRVLEP